MENSGKSRSLYCKRERKHSHENLENHSRPYRRRPCYRRDCRHSLGMRQEVSCPGKRAGNSPGFRRRRGKNRRPIPGGIPSQQSGGFLAYRAGWWLCGGYKCFAKLVLREVSRILGMEKAGIAPGLFYSLWGSMRGREAPRRFFTLQTALWLWPCGPQSSHQRGSGTRRRSTGCRRRP